MFGARPISVSRVVPYMWAYLIHTLGPKVAKWTFDQSSATTGYAHVAVKS